MAVCDICKTPLDPTETVSVAQDRMKAVVRATGFTPTALPASEVGAADQKQFVWAMIAAARETDWSLCGRCAAEIEEADGSMAVGRGLTGAGGVGGPNAITALADAEDVFSEPLAFDTAPARAERDRTGWGRSAAAPRRRRREGWFSSRGVAANAITLLIVLGVVAAGLAGWGVNAWRAPGPLTEEALFEVPRGATLDRVAADLERAGVIESATLFRIGARYARRAESLRFGEYEVPAGASMREVLELLGSGRVVQYAVTIPEGLTSWEIVELLKGEEILDGEIDAIPSEGALAPETYSVSRGDSRGDLIARMRARQERLLAEAWAVRGPDIAVSTPEEALVLASIIEKETAVADERQRVSAVFHNRLRRGMRLQSDPTIIYGITEGEGPLGRPLTRSDINGPTPWNTYVIPGLPPTPIANPGRDSIFAAVQPIQTDELYFVADGTGGHAFARTLSEHNRNVAAWRAIERARDTE
jgi:UPF0755 protein